MGRSWIRLKFNLATLKMSGEGRVWPVGSTNAVYDVDPAQLKLIEKRRLVRESLKKEWQKKLMNPYRGTDSMLFDPAVQRYIVLIVIGSLSKCSIVVYADLL